MRGAVACLFRATLSPPLAGQSEQLGVPVLRSGYFPMYCSMTRGSDDGSTSLPLLWELERSTGGGEGKPAGLTSPSSGIRRGWGG